MSLKRTNLLPQARVRASHRNYFIRLGIVAMLFATVLIIIHGILLLPAYLYLDRKVDAETAQVKHLSTTFSTDPQNPQSQLLTLQNEAKYLQGLGTAPSISSSIQSVLGVARPGIQLTGFVYTAPTQGTPGTLQVSGIATTREQLRNYDSALGALSFVTSTNLPISVYAQESNIPFTDTLTGSFTP